MNRSTCFAAFIAIAASLCGCIAYEAKDDDPKEVTVLPATDETSAGDTPMALPFPQDDSAAGKIEIPSPAAARTGDTKPEKEAVTADGRKTAPPETPETAETKNIAPPKAAAGAPRYPGVPERHRMPQSPENFRRGPGFWRAFSRMTREEQRELLLLQRSDPERFRTIMQHKADELYNQEAARRRELDAMAEKYRSETDPGVKERLLSELREKVKEDFLQRLQDSREDIESYKRRVAHMESELQKREKNCDAIIDAILNSRISGKR